MNLTNLKNKDMSTFKKCQVLLLPTNEEAIINSIIYYPVNESLLFCTNDDLKFINNKDFKLTNNHCYPVHLYILSDEEIKEGDWYMYCHFGEWIISNSRETLKNETNTLENLNKDDYFKKIIATTDFELRTPDSDMKGLNKWIEENL